MKIQCQDRDMERRWLWQKPIELTMDQLSARLVKLGKNPGDIGYFTRQLEAGGVMRTPDARYWMTDNGR